ncbi:MAG: hypothetical protein ACREBZ_00490 [Thermoplasmata archaeon]
MSSESAKVEANPPRLRRPGRWGRVVIAAAIAIVVIVAGSLAYAQWVKATEGPTLVVYTYASLLGGSCGSGGAASGVFANFSSEYHVTVDVECPSGNLVDTLEAQAGSPGADLVVGLDEITGPEAESLGLLVNYTPPGLADVNASLVAALSPDHYVTPYEYGYLGIDYTDSFYNATGGAIANSSFPDFATNSSWADQLLYEDPSIDITGEEFLAWEVLYYETVLHEDWTGFWTSVLPHAHDSSSWDEAFDDFGSANGNLVVSYTTDPASAAYYPTGFGFNTTVASLNGTLYGWETIYGAGIVKGSTHLTLDEEFIDYLLSGSVQSEVPLNEWEYPANSTVALPAVYSDLIPPSSIHALNAAITPSELAVDITGWITTWETLAGE